MSKTQKNSTQYIKEKNDIEITLNTIFKDEGTVNKFKKEETFEKLLRMYSKNIMFRAINKIMMDATFGNINTYLRAIF